MHPNIQVTFDSDPHNDRSESDLAAHPSKANIMVGASKDFTDPATYQFSLRAYATLDGGNTWMQAPPFTLLSNPDPTKAWAGLSDPAVAWDDADNCYVVGLAFARPPGSTSALLLGIAVYKSNSGDLLNWAGPDFIHMGADDKQWAAGDTNPGSPHHGNVYVVWDALNQGLAFARSTDHGGTWKGVGTQPTGTILAPSSFAPQVVVDMYGTVYVVFYAYQVNGLNTIQFVKSTDGGDSFSQPQTVATGITPLPLTLPGGTFRVATLPSCCIAPGFTIVVAWADYRDGVSRVYYRCSRDGGTKWLGSASGQLLLPPPLSSESDQHDFHPQLATNPIGQVACVFYEFGPKTAGGKPMIDVIIAYSYDGTIFSQRETVTDGPWDPTVDPPVAGVTTFIGDYFGLAGNSLGFFPFWTDTRTGIQEIFTARSNIMVPDLIGLDKIDAWDTVRSVSLRLSASGSGEIVAQGPSAGLIVPPGRTIRAILMNIKSVKKAKGQRKTQPPTRHGAGARVRPHGST